MALTEIPMGQGLATTGTTTLYTAAAKSVLRNVIFCNVTAINETITLWVDQDGTSATDAEAIVKDFQVTANDIENLSGLWVVMLAGATIKVSGSTNNSINVTNSGATIT